MTAIRRSRSPLPAAPWRALAALLAMLVVGLGLADASPEAHAWMHGEVSQTHETCSHATPVVPDDPHEDHVCAVVLFAHGAELPVDAAILAQPFSGLMAIILTPDALYLAQPRYLRQPERGPPRT